MTDGKHMYEKLMHLLNTTWQYAISSGVTFIGWLESFTLLQLGGVIVLAIQVYWGYKKHVREEQAHNLKLKEIKHE